jgi:RNA polymerase-binding transcription factor DksA
VRQDQVLPSTKLRSLLIKRKKRVNGALRDHLEDTLLASSPHGVGEVSYPHSHPADLGSELGEQDRNLMLIEREECEISEINAALARLDEGIYGICESCEASIPQRRLEVLPETRYCVSCEEEIESSQVRKAPGNLPRRPEN